MGKDDLHDFIAKQIAEELCNSNTYDVDGISAKVKAILKITLEVPKNDKMLTKLQVRINRQTAALNKAYSESNFWKSKVPDSEKYYNELNGIINKLK